jgi:hypothetical protein
VLLLWVAAWGAQAAERGVGLDGQNASEAVRAVARLALGERNAKGLPFAIVDKKDARLYVFGRDGRLLGASSALIGSAVGDESAPGIGARPSSTIAPHERTTPAGRFASEPGRNLDGEAVVWVDYDAGVAIHRLRPAPAWQRREQRLVSASPRERRISLGCIIVSESFYDAVVAPTLGRKRGVVYVLPDTRSLASVFGRQGAADL